MAALSERAEIKMGKTRPVQVSALKNEAEQNRAQVESPSQKEESQETPLHNNQSLTLQNGATAMHT